MKKLKLLNIVFIVLFVSLFSCSSEDGPKITSITISADGLKDVLRGVESKFVVRDQDNKIVPSSKVSLFVDNNKTTSTNYIFNELRDFSVYATVSDIKSPVIKVRVFESTHTTKVLVEDYTGTWCGYCPRLASALENAVKKNSNIIAAALHDDEDFLFPGVKKLESLFQVTGFPSGRFNRIYNWDESSAQLDKYLAKKKNLGLAINSGITGDEISVDIKVHHDVKSVGKTKLVVYLLENGLVASQSNYYNGDSSSPWYNKGNPIQEFVHNHTARIALTDVEGDEIPDDKNATGITYSINFKKTLPGVIKDSTKLELVAFVVDEKRAVINVQKAKVGENKDFD